MIISKCILQVTIDKIDKLIQKMKQQKSHARIHKVILELREKSRQQINEIMQQKNSQNQNYKLSLSPSPTMVNSDGFSIIQSQSIVLPQDYTYHPNSGNFNLTCNTVSSQSFSPQKSQHSNIRRDIKTARPISRRKFTSKQKNPNNKIQISLQITQDPKKSTNFEQLQILDPSYFIIDNNQNQNEDKQSKQIRPIKAFWSLKHSFVSLFPIEYTQCIIYDHPNVIPIYGEMTLYDCRFVVSNEYKNSSLRDLICEFGAFQQNLCKRYLYQIICGVEQMHNRKLAHNRLSSTNILYNKKGEVFINVVKSTSKPLSEKEKQQKLFNYSPQLLLTKSKSNSLKNDIWSIGIILLDMLFDFTTNNVKNIPFHPYNKNQFFSSNDSIIVDNLKQLYPKSFQSKNSLQFSEQFQEKYQRLSNQCKDVIEKCFVLNKDERIDIKSLKSHKFFG